MIFLVKALGFLAAVQAQEPFDAYGQVPSRLLANEQAEYSCTFTNRWTGTRHPIMYPAADAHWSPPVLVSHNSDYQMWGAGLNATNGVEQVAELGSSTPIIDEIEGASSANNSTGDSVLGVTTFNSQVQEQTFPEIILTGAFPLLSTITMIAPSPDWFSGFYDFDARNTDFFATETWYRRFSIDSYPWDAGTEQGDSYDPGNLAQVPQLPISQFTVDTVPPTGVFLSPDNTTVLPVATWTCILENEPECSKRGSSCTSNLECCSGRCGLGKCLPLQPSTSKFTAKLSRGGQGGAAGRGPRGLRRIRGA